MALLGVILLLAGIGAGLYAYMGAQAATGTTTVTAFGFSREATPLELVAYGAIAMLLFALGWALLSASARRRGRMRREEREDARVAELEERAESQRLDHDRRFEEAGLHDEDLRRRESELAARHDGLDQREAELVRREAASHPGGVPGDMRDGAPAEGRANRTTYRADEGTSYRADDGRDAGTDRDSMADAERAREDERHTASAYDTRSDPTAPADEPPARPAETPGRAHDANRQNV